MCHFSGLSRTIIPSFICNIAKKKSSSFPFNTSFISQQNKLNCWIEISQTIKVLYCSVHTYVGRKVGFRKYWKIHKYFFVIKLHWCLNSLKTHWQRQEDWVWTTWEKMPLEQRTATGEKFAKKKEAKSAGNHLRGFLYPFGTRNVYVGKRDR